MKRLSLGPVTTFVIGAPATVRAVAVALIEYGIAGTTPIPSMGLWHGDPENSVVVRLAGLDNAQDLAEYLRVRFNQEAVYVEQRGKGWLVSRDSQSRGTGARHATPDIVVQDGRERS